MPNTKTAGQKLTKCWMHGKSLGLLLWFGGGKGADSERLREKTEDYDSGNRELKRSRLSTKISEKMVGNKEIFI